MEKLNINIQILTPSVKSDLLRQEFFKMNITLDTVLTQKQLYDLIDKKLGRQFDRFVAEQLYDQMEKDEEGNVTPGDFINVFLQADEILVEKLNTAKDHLEQFQRSREDAAMKLEEIKMVEELNAYGVMKGSVVNVNILEAKELQQLDWDGSGDPYCLVRCGSEVRQTEVGHTSNPVWNQDFVFLIEKGSEEIQISLMDYHKTNKNERASFLQIPVSQFRDQQKFQDWFELRSEQNKPMGKIYLTIQWIHSRVKYLEEVIQHWDQSTKQQQIEYQDFQSDLWTIYEPWKLLYEGQRKQQSVLDFTAKKGVQNSLLLPDSQQNKGILHKLELAQLDYVQQSQLVNLAYVILALFASYYRATFLDMMVGLLFWQWLSMNELIPERIRFLLGLIALSLILDLGWLITYTGGWTSDQNNIGLDTVLEEPAKSFSLIFSYLLFFFKPILGYTYFKAMQILQSSESENQQEIKI